MTAIAVVTVRERGSSGSFLAHATEAKVLLRALYEATIHYMKSRTQESTI